MRNNFDAKLTVTKALPAAAATNYSDPIDLGQTTDHLEGLEVVVTSPATAALVDTKTIVLAVQDSPDNVTFTDTVNVHTVQGAGGVGVAAASSRFRLASNTKRYVRLRQTVATGGGDVTAVSGKLQIAL